MEPFIAAAIQIDTQNNKKENLSKLDHFIDVAKGHGAKLVGMPEFVNFFGEEKEEIENAETIPGPTTDFFCKKAKQHGIWLSCGSIAEKISGKDKLYNSSVFVNPKGEIVSVYRKIHLFDVDIKNVVTVVESNIIMAGEEIVVVDTDLTKVGLSICYDIRFPELYRIMALRGAEIVFASACFNLFTGRDHWETILRARAIENQCYMIAPDGIGKKLLDFPAYGRSLIIDPWGTVIAKASDQEGVISAEIDLEYLHKVRTGLPSLKHRKPETYKW